MTIKGAGVIPKGPYQGQTCYFFGVDAKTKKLKSFGGKKEASDKKLRDCARREFKEEALGAFCKDKTIRDKLKSFKHIVRVETKQYEHVTYVTPFSSFANDPIKQFDKKRHQGGLKHNQKEMQAIVAIPRNELINKISRGNRLVLDTNNRPHMIQIAAFETLKIAYNKNQL
jgi:hypothetical protein